MLPLFELLRMYAPEVTPRNTKLHLAVWSGSEDPLHVYFEGKFESWQSWQNRKNFERDFIVSLIQLPGRNRWLFAGCYRCNGREWVDDPKKPHWSYDTTELKELEPLSGRLVIKFMRSGRASYLDAERWAPDLNVSEMLEQRMEVGDFPGYHKVCISKRRLDVIVSRGVKSWSGALSAVAGVYVITDTTNGKLYVGSATGEGGIWARWCAYSATGHGGNAELRELLKTKGPEYASKFQFAVLEIADTHASREDVLARESHWKNVFKCREHGNNAN